MKKLRIPITEKYQVHITDDYIVIAKRVNRKAESKFEEIYWFSKMEHVIRKLLQLTIVDQYDTMSLEEFFKKWIETINDYTTMINEVLNGRKTV
jgi:hypothetical protein